MTLADIINGANRFWQKVRGERLGIDPDTVVMPKRKRQPCLNPKPTILRVGGLWACYGEVLMTGDEFFGTGDTPEQAMDTFNRVVYGSLDQQLIEAGIFIYIDEIMVYAPPGVFELLPQEIKDFYEPLESTSKP